MQKILWKIFWFLALVAFTSISYFLSVCINCPFIVVVLVAVLFGFLSYRWFNKNIVPTVVASIGKRSLTWSYIILAAGIAILTNKIFYIEPEFGRWDAWALWNYHAKYLDLEHIKFITNQTKLDHPDYPLLLPGIIAFFWKLFGTQSLMVPYIISLFVTIIIPVIIFLALYRKNLIIAGLVLVLMATDDKFIDYGLFQYADLPLGLFFLCAFISVQYAKENKAMVTFTAIFLGCCIWTKNEGSMLSLVFILFHLKTLFANGKWKNFLAGFLLPLVILTAYKIYMPATDIIGEQSHKTLLQFLDWDRYNMIWASMSDNINDRFFYLKIGAMIYAVICLAEKKMPGKDMLVLLTCLIAVFFVYVFTTKDLQWHLESSMDRVLFQLMPAFTFVIGLRLCKLRFYLSDEIRQ